MKRGEREISSKITTDRLKEDFLSDETNINDRDSAKKWFQKVNKKLEEYKLFKYWAKDNKDKVNQFLAELEQKLKNLSKNNE